MGTRRRRDGQTPPVKFDAGGEDSFLRNRNLYVLCSRSRPMTALRMMLRFIW